MADVVECCCCGECDSKGHPAQIERDYTPDEIAARKIAQDEYVAQQEAQKAAADAKAALKESASAKLTKLGLTADEISEIGRAHV